jgi:hypothetical protein
VQVLVGIEFNFLHQQPCFLGEESGESSMTYRVSAGRGVWHRVEAALSNISSKGANFDLQIDGTIGLLRTTNALLHAFTMMNSTTVHWYVLPTIILFPTY